MLTLAEKLGYMKARAVEVCTKIGFCICTGLKQVFGMNLQENRIGKEKT